MTQNNLTLGFLGEKKAIEFLKSKGYRIIDHNFRIRNGEIDIIAIESETLVFIEVKTRRNVNYGSPEEAITPAKIRFLIRASQYYKLTHPRLPESMRIDAVAIILNEQDEIAKIDLYKNITL